MNSLAQAVKDLEEENARLRKENELLLQRIGGVWQPDAFTIQWVAEQFRNSADKVTFPDGIPASFANELPAAYDNGIQLLLAKWAKEHSKPTKELCKYKLAKYNMPVKNGYYYLIEYLGQPMLLLRDENDWCCDGILVDNNIIRDMAILAELRIND